MSGHDEREAAARYLPRRLRGLDLALAGLSLRPASNAVEVVQEFAEHGEVVATALGLAANGAKHAMQGVHLLFSGMAAEPSLKRASSRTKSSKRRICAASSRSANQPSAELEPAHSASARCARSPRSPKVRISSSMSYCGAAGAALNKVQGKSRLCTWRKYATAAM